MRSLKSRLCPIHPTTPLSTAGIAARLVARVDEGADPTGPEASLVICNFLVVNVHRLLDCWSPMLDHTRGSFCISQSFTCRVRERFSSGWAWNNLDGVASKPLTGTQFWKQHGGVFGYGASGLPRFFLISINLYASKPLARLRRQRGEFFGPRASGVPGIFGILFRHLEIQCCEIWCLMEILCVLREGD